MNGQSLATRLKLVIEEDFGIEVSLDDASEILRDMTGYFDLLAQIHHRAMAKNKDHKHESQGSVPDAT
jgi:hypothetical protein